jgi:3-dehydroquinate synthetase
MKRDKKTRSGHVRFVLVSDVGQWYTQVVPDETIIQALEVFYG